MMNTSSYHHRSQHFKVFCFLVVLLLLFTCKLWFFGHVLCGGDLVNHYVPAKEFWKKCANEGLNVPLWNPLIFSGRPFQADIQVGMFYPPNWLCLLLPVPLALTLLTIVHLLWGGLGMYWFARQTIKSTFAAFTAACIFMLSSFFVTRLYSGIVIFIFTAAWLPHIFFLSERWYRTRRFIYVLWLAIVLALQLLAGSPQVAFYTWYALGLAVLFQLIFPPVGTATLQPAHGATDYNPSLQRNSSAGSATPGTHELIRAVAFGSPRLRLLVGYVVAFALAVALSAVQILPTWQLIRHSYERAHGGQWSYITEDSLPLRMLPTFWAPNFYLSPIREDLYWGSKAGYWEVNAYMGVAPLLLAILAVICWRRGRHPEPAVALNQENGRQRSRIFWCMLVMGLVGLALAFGDRSPLFRLFYWIAPGFDRFRAPARTVLLYTFAVAMLAGYGLELFLAAVQHAMAKLKVRLNLAILLLALVIVIPTAIVLANLRSILTPRILSYLELDRTLQATAHLIDLYVYAARTDLMRSAGLALATLAILFCFLKSLIPKKTFIVLFTLALLLDLFSFGMQFVRSIPGRDFNRAFYPRTERVAFLEQYGTEGRSIFTDDVFFWYHDQNQLEIFPNRTMVHGLPSARGYDPIYLTSYAKYMNTINKTKPGESPGAFLTLEKITNAKMLSLLNVRLILTYTDFKVPELRLVASYPFGLHIYENPSAVGWAFLATAVHTAGLKESAILSLLANPEFDALHIALTDQLPPILPIATESGGTTESVTLVSYQPDRRSYEAVVHTSNLLVFSENYYPGWEVYIDNRPAELVRVDYTLCGVFVPPGVHRVTMAFRPPTFRLGAGISGFAVLVVVLTVAGFGIRRRYAKPRQEGH
jgi:hypothetical protein